MYFINLVRNKTAGAFIGLGVLLLSIASLVLYSVYVSKDSDLLMMPWVIVFLVFAIAGEVVLFFLDNDYLPVVIAMFPMFALGCFAASPLATLFSVASYFGEGIFMDGANPDYCGLIIGIAVLFVVTSAAAVAACFFKRVKKETA